MASSSSLHPNFPVLLHIYDAFSPLLNRLLHLLGLGFYRSAVEGKLVSTNSSILQCF